MTRRNRSFAAPALTLALILSLTLAVAMPTRAQQRPGRRQPSGVRVERDLVYRQAPVKNSDKPKDMLLDLYLPDEDAAADNKATRPLIVWIHGGGWQGGSKNGCPFVWLVGKGYAVASISYRLSHEAIFPAQIEDCKAAIRWLRANAEKYGYDATKVGVGGASAGGHLVALLGTSGDIKELEGDGGNADRSSRVQAVVDLFGPTDFLDFAARSERMREPTSPVYKLFGGPVSEKTQLAKLASPVAHVTKDDAPTYILQGDQDRLVPLRQSELLDEAMKKAGVEVELQVIEGGGHGGPGFGTPEINGKILAFFDKHLREPKATSE